MQAEASQTGVGKFATMEEFVCNVEENIEDTIQMYLGCDVDRRLTIDVMRRHLKQMADKDEMLAKMAVEAKRKHSRLLAQDMADEEGYAYKRPCPRAHEAQALELVEYKASALPEHPQWDKMTCDVHGRAREYSQMSMPVCLKQEGDAPGCLRFIKHDQRLVIPCTYIDCEGPRDLRCLQFACYLADNGKHAVALIERKFNGWPVVGNWAIEDLPQVPDFACVFLDRKVLFINQMTRSQYARWSDKTRKIHRIESSEPTSANELGIICRGGASITALRTAVYLCEYANHKVVIWAVPTVAEPPIVVE